MSTYYYFVCNDCKSRIKSLAFTRQAWGWGNAAIIDTFQFLMKHTCMCGEEFIELVSEHDHRVEMDSDYKDDTSEKLLGFFPHSHEWGEDETTEGHKLSVLHNEYLKRNENE